MIDAPVQLYDATYQRFELDARRSVRLETYGEDFGQNGWLTAGEWRAALDRLELTSDSRVLDVACGSGGPDIHLARTTGAAVVGVDINTHAIAAAREHARRAGLVGLVTFAQADAARALPFEDGSFDAVVCIDAINHLPDRPRVLRDWQRLLRPGGRIVFSDPAVVTGLVSSDELALCASIGHFVFSAHGENVRLIRRAGLELVRCEDTTGSIVRVARRWRQARARHRVELLADEGEETFTGLQRYLAAVEDLAYQHRLSRQTLIARATPLNTATCSADTAPTAPGRPSG
ncbi:MAG: class I SAM-dependent methyltransferase [Haloechinothrix sp.]